MGTHARGPRMRGRQVVDRVHLVQRCSRVLSFTAFPLGSTLGRHEADAARALDEGRSTEPSTLPDPGSISRGPPRVSALRRSRSAHGDSAARIDREALAGGALLSRRQPGILPDGLLFDMPLSDPTPPPKQLEGAFATGSDDARRLPGPFRSTARWPQRLRASRERDTRYRAEELLRRDETTGRASGRSRWRERTCASFSRANR